MIERRLLARITGKKARLDALRPLPAAALLRLSEQISVEMIYHSNAIEGNTLTLQETRLILETGITIGGKSLREHFEVINHQEALTYVEDLASGMEAITPFHVRQIHKLVLTRIDDENAGQYRTLPVRIAGASHQPPDAWEVPLQMAEWGDWLQGPALTLHPIERAALTHHRLAAIHPFIDGNGRTARLVINLLLLREGYPPTIILRTNRQQYYRVGPGPPGPFSFVCKLRWPRGRAESDPLPGCMHAEPGAGRAGGGMAFPGRGGSWHTLQSRVPEPAGAVGPVGSGEARAQLGHDTTRGGRVSAVGEGRRRT